VKQRDRFGKKYLDDTGFWLIVVKMFFKRKNCLSCAFIPSVFPNIFAKIFVSAKICARQEQMRAAE
jgi:hypothetical protein